MRAALLKSALAGSGSHVKNVSLHCFHFFLLKSIVSFESLRVGDERPVVKLPVSALDTNATVIFIKS